MSVCTSGPNTYGQVYVCWDGKNIEERVKAGGVIMGDFCFLKTSLRKKSLKKINKALKNK